MPDQNYNTGNGLSELVEDAGPAPRRKMTDAEVEALMTLVRGGWLKLELTDGF